VVDVPVRVEFVEADVDVHLIRGWRVTSHFTAG
jgi:hypothetical protein